MSEINSSNFSKFAFFQNCRLGPSAGVFFLLQELFDPGSSNLFDRIVEIDLRLPSLRFVFTLLRRLVHSHITETTESGILGQERKKFLFKKDISMRLLWIGELVLFVSCNK